MTWFFYYKINLILHLRGWENLVKPLLFNIKGLTLSYALDYLDSIQSPFYGSDVFKNSIDIRNSSRVEYQANLRGYTLENFI